MADIEEYPLHGGQLRRITERFGIPLSELLDFSANINPAGPPPSVLTALRASLGDPSTLTHYPDLQLTELKRTIARHAAIEEQNIIVANGFVPLLDAALSALKIHTCLLPVPAFVEYRRTLERAGVEIVPHRLSARSSFRYDAAAMLTGRQDAVLLANPQNPSGTCHDAGSVRDLVTISANRGTYVLLDEAFIDYVPEHSMATMIDDFPNLIVFRSVTKFYGIPGLRIAYAIANPALAMTMSSALPPWPVTTLASVAVISALEDEAYAEQARSENAKRRDALLSGLASCGLTLYPASANFVLFRLPHQINPKVFWERMIVDHRVVVRSCSNYEGLADGHFRAAVRTEAENRQLAAAVKRTLTELKARE